jgi:hypothetical protein
MIWVNFLTTYCLTAVRYRLLEKTDPDCVTPDSRISTYQDFPDVLLKITSNSTFLRRTLITFCHFDSGYCVLSVTEMKKVKLRQENLFRCLIKR